MTHGQRIRTFLIIAAMLPAFMILLFLYARQGKESNQLARRAAEAGLSNYLDFYSHLKNDTRTSVRQLALSTEVQEAVIRLGSDQRSTIFTPGNLPGYGQIDFAEIMDDDNLIVASWKRPGLVGQKPDYFLPSTASGQISTNETLAAGQAIEYDVDGAHAALHFVEPIDRGYRLLGGAYLDSAFLRNAQFAADTRLHLYLPNDTGEIDERFNRMSHMTLFVIDDGYRALLAGGREVGYYLMASFDGEIQSEGSASLLPVAATVALASVLVAVGLGLYIAGRTKREIDNLVNATSRISEGDFTTPVMAYEEGEFAELADSFSEMMQKLKDSQTRLASAQKIAAWQVMGRKVAHEIKNPLTPISIAVDDMRRSYQEKLPRFDQTLLESTEMIKREIHRLNLLLDRFVKFARMAPSDPHPIALNDLISDISDLYRPDISKGRVSITNLCENIQVKVDSDQFCQLCLNLIKNGLEAGLASEVMLSFKRESDGLRITASDNGPGFSEEYLESQFEPYISSKKEGSGLGLVICQRIVADHGGTIRLYNSEKQGAVVEVTLPQE